PSAFSITLGFAPSMTATQLLVVPRSIPITFAICISLSFSEPCAKPFQGKQLRILKGVGSLVGLKSPVTGPAAYIGGCDGGFKRDGARISCGAMAPPGLRAAPNRSVG